MNYQRGAIVLALAMSSASMPGTASATVLTFEDLAGQPAFASLPANYGGISWAPNFWAAGFPQFPYTPHSGVMRVGNNGANPGDSSFGFNSDAIFEGAWFAGNLTVSLDWYLDGALLGTSAGLTLSSTPQFFGGYGGAVDRVVVNGTVGQYVFDDLQFHDAPVRAVPEPLTLGLFATGLLALACTRRRQLDRPIALI
jgi:hypothetical protein